MKQDINLLIEQTMAEVDLHANNKDWTMYIVSELNLNRLLQERNYQKMLEIEKYGKVLKIINKEIELLKELIKFLLEKKTFWESVKAFFKR